MLSSAIWTASTPATFRISGLNYTARSLAVYASQGGLPHRYARLASGWLASLSGRDWLSAGSLTERFQVIPFSFPRLCLAHPNNAENSTVRALGTKHFPFPPMFPRVLRNGMSNSFPTNPSEIRSNVGGGLTYIFSQAVPAATPLKGIIAMTELPQHVLRNRAHWDHLAVQFVAVGEHAWACQEPSWGIWSVPEDVVRMFPDKLASTDAIELGCGTAYVSSWLALRGARVVGIDNSEQQLATARRLQREHGLDFPLIHGNAEIRPVPRCELRFRYFGIWGLSLGRSAEVGA